MAVVVVLVRDAAHNKSPVSNPERRGCLMWTTLDHQTCKHPRCEEGAACGGKWKTTLLSHLNKSHLREETEVTDVASWKGHDHTSGVSQTETQTDTSSVCVCRNSELQQQPSHFLRISAPLIITFILHEMGTETTSELALFCFVVCFCSLAITWSPNIHRGRQEQRIFQSQACRFLMASIRL